jgi:hypothetical protein
MAYVHLQPKFHRHVRDRPFNFFSSESPLPVLDAIHFQSPTMALAKVVAVSRRTTRNWMELSSTNPFARVHGAAPPLTLDSQFPFCAAATTLLLLCNAARQGDEALDRHLAPPPPARTSPNRPATDSRSTPHPHGACENQAAPHTEEQGRPALPQHPSAGRRVGPGRMPRAV